MAGWPTPGMQRDPRRLGWLSVVVIGLFVLGLIAMVLLGAAVP